MISHLQFKNFRSYCLGAINPERNINVLFGPNGCGKTSVLESVFILSTTKSFKTSRNKDFIRLGEVCAEIESKVLDQTVKINIEQRKKTFLKNEKKPKNISDFCSVFSVVVLAPEHQKIIFGQKEERLKYLDQILFSQDKGYLSLLSKYKRAYKQKKALLGQKLPFGVYQDHVFVWNQDLVFFGEAIRKKRQNLLVSLEGCFKGHHEKIAQPLKGGRSEDVVLVYQGSKEWMDGEIQKKAHMEHVSGQVLVGPHRDDLGVFLGGRLCKSGASLGEVSSVLLALKLSEIDLYGQEKKEVVLALDDIGVALDEKRRKTLFDFIEETDLQTFVSTSDPNIKSLGQEKGGRVFLKQEVSWEGEGQAHVWL